MATLLRSVRAAVADSVGLLATTLDHREAFDCEGGPCAIPHEVFEAFGEDHDFGPLRQMPSQSLRYRDHPLPHGDGWDDVIDEVCRRLCHASAVARRADAAAIAREGSQKRMATGTAACPGEPKAKDGATEARAKLLLDMRRDGVLTEASLGEPGLEVAGDRPVEQRWRRGYGSGCWCGVQGCARTEERAGMLRRHRDLILNWFRAQGLLSSGTVEGLNGKAKVTTRKAYGFRTKEGIETALFHTLGHLPEPDFTHRFC